MKIQPISVFNYTKTPVNNVHRTPKFTPIQDSVNFGSIFNHSEKKTLPQRCFVHCRSELKLTYAAL